MKTNPAKICVPVFVSRAIDLPAAIARAAEVADIVELRLDYLAEGEREQAASLMAGQLKSADVPIILTLRSREQGGQNKVEYDVRRRFWTSLHDLPPNCLVDLELDLVLDFAARDPRAESWLDWSRVICSHHDFSGVPGDLEEIYETMVGTPARILKIAVQAHDATDCLPIFALLERARRDGREMIAIAMGPAGIMTRILGPSRGSFLTYGSLDDDSATAPGQLTANQLRDVFRIEQNDEETEIIGIMGNPVEHSLSPLVHNAAFVAAHRNAVYIPFEVIDAVRFMNRMAHPRSRELEWRLRGLSVTAPHKSTVLDQLDWLDPVAKEIGAVNTIVVRENELHGYNTDAAGFIEPLRRQLGSLKGARCAIIGGGGGARAAIWALRNASAQIALFVRDLEKARSMSEEFEVDSYLLSSASFKGFDVVVNATPLGTRNSREDETAATADQLREVRLAYDLVYNPMETRFLREARVAGAETLGGIEMLLAQAFEQFKLWTGTDPDVEAMRSAAMRALASQSS